MSVVFDKLSRLEDAGNFSRPQAEARSDAFHQAVSETVATKQDVASVRSDLERSISLLRTEIHHEMSLVRSELRTGLAETKVWTVSVGATIIAVLAAMKYFG